jgi:uncharacterized protein YqhQ
LSGKSQNKRDLGVGERVREKPHIGGQAVIEGVMIRNRYMYSIAVRKPDGTIDVVRRSIHSPAQKHKILRAPFFRGVTALVENLVLGIKSLLYSAEVALPEEENKKKKKKESTSTLLLFFGLVPALALGVGLFMVVPNLSTHFLGFVETESPFVFNVIAGGIRLAVFLLYILVISYMKDIRRTFQYHGAEHKSIFCFESERPLVPEEAQRFRTLHPRCGTSFLFFVLFIAILIFPIFTIAIQAVYQDFASLPLVYRKLVTLFLHLFIALPLIASLSYEMLKLSDRFRESLLMKMLIFPGLLLQKITTREPDGEQIEVAIAAVKAVL